MANQSPNFYIFDFDSTIVTTEALDELAAILLSGSLDGARMVSEIEEITRLGMSGKIEIGESLERRLQLIRPRREHLSGLVELLKTKLSPSMLRNRDFFSKNSEFIFVVSSGFKEYILPVVEVLGIPSSRVFANTFAFDSQGQVIGVDPESRLASTGSKVRVVEQLKLNGQVHVIGDGITDYEIRAAGAADLFYAYTECVSRAAVVEKADFVVSSFDEFLLVKP